VAEGIAAVIILLDLSRRAGGTVVRVHQIASALQGSADMRVGVLEGSETAARLASTGVSLLRLRGHPKSPTMLGDLVRLFKEVSPSVVDAHNPQSQLWGLTAARLCGVPRRIATIHSRYRLTEGGGSFYRAYPLLLSGLATDIVAVCETVAADYSKLAAGKLHIIYNGLSLAPPSPMSPQDDGSFRICVVGRLTGVKGQAILLDALSRVHDKLLPYECLMVGEGPDRRALEARSCELGLSEAVTFLGNRGDVPALMAQAHLLVIPSLMEGLPYVALEAGVLGRPILASAAGGLAVHFVDGETARLVPPGRPDALAKALLWCRTHRQACSTMAQRAQTMVTERFPLERMITATRALYGLSRRWEPRAGDRD
jgi:glycosyltransferase involved in cell wall biosynthesis